MKISDALLLCVKSQSEQVIPTYVWELPFTIETNELYVDLDTIPGYDPSIHTFSSEEFYGIKDDDFNWEFMGSAVFVEVIYLGHAGNPHYDPHPIDMWGERYSWDSPNSSDGPATWDEVFRSLNFLGGSFGTKYYKLVKYNMPVNRRIAP